MTVRELRTLLGTLDQDAEACRGFLGGGMALIGEAYEQTVDDRRLVVLR